LNLWEKGVCVNMKIRKKIVVFIFTQTTFTQRFKNPLQSLPLRTISLAATVPICSDGKHLESSKCIPNNTNCDDYDSSDGNCKNCNWLTFWVKNDTEGQKTGNYCETRWWFWILSILSLIFLLVVTLVLCYFCFCAKPDPKKRYQPLREKGEDKSHFNVQRTSNINEGQMGTSLKMSWMQEGSHMQGRGSDVGVEGIKHEQFTGFDHITGGKGQKNHSDVVERSVIRDGHTYEIENRNVAANHGNFHTENQGHNQRVTSYNPMKSSPRGYNPFDSYH